MEGKEGTFQGSQMREVSEMHATCPLRKLFFAAVIFGFWGAIPIAYGSSQDRGHIGAVAAGSFQPKQCQIQGVLATSTTAHSNAGSLTHCVRLGTEHTSSWMLVRFATTVP